MMKRLVPMIAFLAINVIFSNVFAETPKNLGPEVINLKMGIFVLPFQHKKHQAKLNNECYHCHQKNTSGKIDGWGKESAHSICIPCHDLEEKGPIECHLCHKK